MRYNSSENQDIKRDFVQREVYTSVNSMVEYILGKSFEDSNVPFGYEDLINYYVDNSDEIEELKKKLEDLEAEKDDVIEKLETQKEEAEDRLYEEIEESQDLFDIDEISEFTHDRNLINFNTVYNKITDKINEEIEAVENAYEDSEDLLASELEDLEMENGKQNEVLEWWVVSSWLCGKLKEEGEVVLEDENIWGRQTSGQAILLDGVISRICEEAGMLKEDEDKN